MAQIDITRMSSKGQIVIPQDLRKGFNEGDKIVVIRSNDQIILKRADKMDKQLKEDIEVAKRVEKAWKDIDEGRYKTYTVEEFKRRLKNGASKVD
ncbi:MAG: AbrB/MazE/SpoVT family DNA-binding domain-containing protein [Nanoarchaeota archaeon]